MAAVLFVYGASGLLAPVWAVVVLVAVWVLAFGLCVRWWTPHPRRVAVVPVVLALGWFAAMNAGGAWLGWTA